VIPAVALQFPVANQPSIKLNRRLAGRFSAATPGPEPAADPKDHDER